MTDHTPVPSASTDGKARSGCWFFMLPVVFAGLIFAAYLVLFFVGSLGSGAGGDRVEMRFDGCDSAQPLIALRVEQMGLGDPVFDRGAQGFSLTATLPNSPAAPHIPATLARTGDFHIRAGESSDSPEVVGPGAVQKAQLSLKELGNPLVEITLNEDGKNTLESHMEDHLTDVISVWIDGEKLMARPNDPPFRSAKIDLRAEGEDGVDNLRRAADWGMVLTHGPLPCQVSVTSVTSLTTAAQPE